jgi:hypothetical protein
MGDAPCAGFLTEIQLEHGPVELIGRFLRYADALNRAQGVVLSFATLEQLQDVNERNAESWKPLFPAFNPKLNSIPPDQAFCLLGRNADGEVVSAQAARLFTWEGTNLRQEAESLRWFYDDPEASKRPGESCVVTAPSAPGITGRVAFLGAVWYRPDYRKRLPTVIDLRIGHYYALSKWRPDYFSLVMVESLATRGLAPRFGREPEWEILLTNNISFGDARLALIHAPYDETLGRFVRFMADNETEIDAVLGNMGTESAGQEIQAKT